ncbi:uncharacterized protein LOC109793665 [Cajanus cajan]|uniref:uncharacterized protein LOC109793665 n=1 Tax=Cajanus cajan TaxID=3821 RepID=UPI00098DB085|nr:uncharacterized protein LOC109793665 [Cajanus cajan]
MVRPQYDQIVRAMEMMAMAMQQQTAHFARVYAERAAAGATGSTGSHASRDMAEFKKCSPPQFRGDADPDVADHWICELEKIFSVLGCSEERKLAYAVYMLTGEAEYWWRGTSQMMIDRGVVVDWVCFKRVFLEKYFPESVRHAREAEFMRLQQGGMLVTEYAIRFEHLARFYTQAISEAWKCRKFAEEKAKVVERLESVSKPAKAVGGLAGSKSGGGAQRKPYDRPQPQQGGPATRKPIDTARSGGQSGVATIRCYRCGGPHFIRDCPHTESKCFRCGQMGHVSTSCPAGNWFIPKGDDELLKSSSQAEVGAVGEFSKVFLDEVSGLPPIREIKISIDLVPSVGPVLVAPYRMALTKLVELKCQVEELKRKIDYFSYVGVA